MKATAFFTIATASSLVAHSAANATPNMANKTRKLEPAIARFILKSSWLPGAPTVSPHLALGKHHGVRCSRQDYDCPEHFTSQHLKERDGEAEDVSSRRHVPSNSRRVGRRRLKRRFQVAS